MTVQVRFISKMITNNFVADFKEGYALILDANGQEFKLDGKNITGFRLYNNRVRVVSLRFKGTKEKTITEPFDLTIKGSDLVGEITFFDLMYSK